MHRIPSRAALPRRWFAVVAIGILILGLLVACRPEEPIVGFHQGDRPLRGVNMGNALEAPVEGEWGMVIEDGYFELIRKAGFDLVRIPIRWADHALKEAPHTIDAAFFERVSHVIDAALAQDLVVVINIHHFDELAIYPDGHKARFLALWRQISTRYAEYDQKLYFELYNEPHDALYGDRWNEYAAEAVAVIRETNPTRTIVIGPGNWNRLTQFYELELPDDEHIVATFHYYDPFNFTHQGAEWAEGSRQWLGMTWDDTEVERRMLAFDMEMAKMWADEHGYELFMGEFGAYEKADLDSRVRWTRAVVEEAEARGIAWAYWEFGAGFGVYDREKGAWREPLLEAMMIERPKE